MKKILITNKPDLKSLFVNGLLLTFKPDHYIDLQQTAFYIYDIFHKENGDYTFSKANVRHFEIGAQIFVIDGVKILALHKEQNRRFPLSQAIRLGKKHDCAVIFARTKERVFRYQDQILIIGLDSFESNQLLGLSFSVLIAVEAGLFCYASLIRHKEVSVYTGQVKNELIQRVYAPTTRLQSKYQLDNKFEDFYIEKIAKQQATQLTTGAAELLEIHNLQRHIRPNTLMKTIVPHSQEEEQLKNPVSLSHLDHLVSRKSDLPVKEKPVDYYLHPYGPKRTYLIDQLLEQHWDTAYQKKITDDKSEDMAVLESEEDADYGEVAPQTTSSSGDQSYLSSTPEPVELTFPPEATAKKEVEETKSAPFSDQLSEVSPVTVDYLGYDFGAGGEVFEETSVEEKPAVVFDEKELPSQPSDPNPPLPEEPTEQGRKLAVPMDDHVDDDYSHYAGKPIIDDQGFELEELITTSDDHKLAGQEEELLIPSEEVKTTPDQQLEPSSSLPADLLASSADAEQFVTPEINQDDEGWVPYEQYTEEGVSTEPALVERDDSQEDIFDKLISEWNQGLAEQQKEEHLEPEPLTAVTESGRDVTFGDDQQLEDQSQATTLEPSLVEDQSFTSKPSFEQQEEKVEQEFTYDNNQPTGKPAEAGKKSRFFGRFLGGLFARKKQSPQPPKEFLEQEFSAADDGDEQDTETSTKQQATKLTNLEEGLADLTKEPQLTKHSADHDPFLSDDFWEESVGKTELSSQEAFQPLQQEVSPSESTFDQLLQVQEVGSSLENEPGLAMEREEQLVSGKLEEESLVGQQLTGIDTEEQKEIPKKMFTEETSPISEELMPDEMGPTDEVVPQIFEQQKISPDLDLDSDLSKLKPLEDYLYQKSPFSVDDSQQPTTEEQETEEKLTSTPFFLKEDEDVTEESEKSLEDFSFQPPFPYKSLADDQQLTGIDGQQQPETPETVLTQPIATDQKELVSEEMGPTDEVVPQIFGQQKISLDLELDSDLSKLKPLATNLSSAKPFSVTASEQLTAKIPSLKEDESLVEEKEQPLEDFLSPIHFPYKNLTDQQLTEIGDEQETEDYSSLLIDQTDPSFKETEPTKDKYLSDLPKDHKTQTFTDDLDVHDFTNFHQRQFDDPEDGQLLTDFQPQPVSQQPEEQVLDPVATGVSGHDHQQDHEPKQPFTKDLSTDQQSFTPFLEDQDQQVDLTTSKIAALTAKSWVKRKQIIKELLVNFEDALLVINEFNQIVDLGVDYIQDASIWTQVQKEQVHTWKHKVEDHLFQKSIEEQYQNGRFLISNHKVRLVNQQLVYFVFKFMKRAIRLLNILIDHEHSLNKGKKDLKIHHKSMRRLEHLFKGYQKKYQLE